MSRASFSRIRHAAAPLDLSHTSRRDVLRLAAGASCLPFVSLLGCDDEDDAKARDAAAGDEDSGAPGGSSDAWASGGTAAMTAKASYPSPFTSAASNCVLVATTTEGPCTTETDLDREDISEEWRGLPVRLALRVVDDACAPVAAATVKIWHTNYEGSYSGQTPNNDMCLQQQSYASTNFFRGVQTTGANGTVFFDSCFPGWYPGRAIHIHFQVKNGTTSYRVSQLFFPEDVTESVFDDHPDYSAQGQPDTVLATDDIISGIPAAERDRHIFAVARMTDGVMLASKTVTVR